MIFLIIFFIYFINIAQAQEYPQDFFEYHNFKRARFISGPFTNMIFEIISNQRSELKILIDGLMTTINKKSNYLYRPV